MCRLIRFTMQLEIVGSLFCTHNLLNSFYFLPKKMFPVKMFRKVLSITKIHFLESSKIIRKNFSVKQIFLNITAHVSLWISIFLKQIATQQTFVCSDLTMETPGQCAKYVLVTPINNRDTRATSVTSFWCPNC